MTFGSLFAGIGGLDLGLERAGMECKWQVEIDDYCRRVLAKHWPDVQRHGDIRDVGRHNLAHVDLVCGGFPCQDISFARGAGAKGLDGDKSGLFFELMRVVREIRPRFVLLENVPALLVRGMGRVLGELAACGFDAEWDCIPAGAFGAHFRGDRVFVFASYSSADCLRRRREWSKETQQGTRKTWSTDEFARLVERELRLCVPTRRGDRVRDGVPRRLDRLRGLGNAVVPQVAEWIGRRILEAVS
jgi:DNA (cytosine-5)-methyltransferase 1